MATFSLIADGGECHVDPVAPVRVALFDEELIMSDGGVSRRRLVFGNHSHFLHTLSLWRRCRHGSDGVPILRSVGETNLGETRGRYQTCVLLCVGPCLRVASIQIISRKIAVVVAGPGQRHDGVAWYCYQSGRNRWSNRVTCVDGSENATDTRLFDESAT